MEEKEGDFLMGERMWFKSETKIETLQTASRECVQSWCAFRFKEIRSDVESFIEGSKDRQSPVDWIE